MAGAWISADLATIVALFAPYGLFVSPAGAAYGHDQIRAVAAAYFQEFACVGVQIRRVLADGSRGAAEWTWQETTRGAAELRTMEDAIVFEVRDNKLVYWREYFDPNQRQALIIPGRSK